MTTPKQNEQPAEGPAPVSSGLVMAYSVDDRGNVADFYHRDEFDEYSRVARLDREAGPQDDVDGVYTWDGAADVTEWAMANGYQWEIRFARRLARLSSLEAACHEYIGHADAVGSQGWLSYDKFKETVKAA